MTSATASYYASQNGAGQVNNIEKKNNFILLRAKGKSYTEITKELEISKGTCTEWEKELKQQIADKKAEELESLYNCYYMTKEAKIKELGETLKKIDKAIEQADFSNTSTEKLLELKLKYQEALQAEYIPLPTGERDTLPENANAKDLYNALIRLANRIRAGEVTPDQANKEQHIITSLLKAYETVELQQKLERLEALLGGR